MKFLNFLAKIPEFWKNSDFDQVAFRGFLSIPRILTELRSEKFEWFDPSPIEPFNSGPERVNWVVSNPGQISLNASQVHWTAEVEDSITKNKLDDYFACCTTQLLQLVAKVRTKVAESGRQADTLKVLS